jgi:hypothetical protein
LVLLFRQGGVKEMVIEVQREERQILFQAGLHNVASQKTTLYKHK